ncbi:MAG: hypothetical protein V3576_02145 [Candidatus Cloacimonadota bacterium]
MIYSSKFTFLIATIFVLMLCSCQQDNIITDSNNSKFVYTVNPDIISESDSLHTLFINQLMQDPYVCSLIDLKRKNNNDYFYANELDELNGISKSIFDSYDSDQNVIACFEENLEMINDLSYSVVEDKYVFNTDFEKVVSDYATTSRDYNDPDLGPVFSQLDEIMASFRATLISDGYEVAYANFFEETSAMAESQYPSQESADCAAMLIGIGRSSVSLLPEYATAFGMYEDDPLTYPELGLALTADASWWAMGAALNLMPWIPKPYVGIVVGGGFVCSGTIVIMNLIHHTHY